MKKTTSKLLALALAGVLALGTFGCGEKKTDTPDPTKAAEPTKATAADPTKAPDPTATPTPETFDFGGVTVKVFGAAWGNVESEETKYVEAKAYIEKKYNIKLEKASMEGYDGTNDADILIQSIAAGDPAAHIINLNPESMVTAFSKDILFDLTDYIDELEVGKAYTDVASWKGRVYGVAYENIGDTWVLVYNRDYLKEIGMTKTPTDMFMEGKWDYESFKQYCAEMKSKLPDGVYPIGQYPYHWGVMAASANGAQLVNADGSLNLTDEAVVEATQFYQQLEEDGLAFPMYLHRDADGNIAKKEDGSGDYALAYALDDERIVMKRVETWQLGGIDYNYGIVFWPWGSNVTCTGDYTTLSDNYATAGAYWGFDAIIKAAVEKTGIPGNILAKIDKEWRCLVEDNHFEYITEAYKNEQQGIYTNESPEKGDARSFRTEQDITLFDWGHTRYKSDLSWGYASADICDTWQVFQDIFMEYKDVRSTLQSFQNEGTAKLKEMGVVK